MVCRFVNLFAAVAALLAVGGCGTDSPTSGSSESFATTGQMVQQRFCHSATRLQDGKVLIAGGTRAVSGPTAGRLTSAEVYDPTTGEFRSTGDMVHARGEHQTTLLQDGRALIVGGGVDTAEPYDPASGRFTATGDLSAIQTVRTTTLMSDGRVFVTGDNIPIGEIYDPGTGLFMRTQRVGPTRIGHTVTPMPEGRLLFVGGGVSVAGLYDPISEVFSAVGELTQLRFGHTATRLPSGNILIAGGSGRTGGGAFAPTPGAEIHDPALRTFTFTGPMGAARFGHTAILLPNGKVLLVGGADAEAEMYDPETGVFEFVGGSLGRVRRGHTTSLLSDGRVLIAGGTDKDFALLDRAILYRP